MMSPIFQNSFNTAGLWIHKTFKPQYTSYHDRKHHGIKCDVVDHH